MSTTQPLGDLEVSLLSGMTLEEVSTYRGRCLEVSEQLRKLIGETVATLGAVDELEAQIKLGEGLLEVLDEDQAIESVRFALRLREVTDLCHMLEAIVQDHAGGEWYAEHIRERAAFWSVDLGDY